MPIRFDSPNTGPLPRETIEGLAQAQKAKKTPAKPVVDTMHRSVDTAAQAKGEKFSPTLSSPGGARNQPPFMLECSRLEALIRAGGPGVSAAAHEAMRHIMKYTLRRSKGARKSGLNLCDAISEEAPDCAELAGQLKEVLMAEADLQEVSADGTLRACKRLVALLSAIEE